ncbi:beta strand repeat-containing protein [Halovibrio sp. HP20-50]|uniref:beta strand repeat-containing protein n=1 Tax=Halovibrio sp. HP20-59 TaxID=3080275 RepID=UPI00294B4006|nr:DUF4214 domain-containing protein [Halovibrio sp. HP20-59]MEA2120095.1 DUF4214 domain-containing protein [Halovibrio sp. HP20-59]
MALTKTQVSELYVAIFNRASEGAGNSYWQGLDLSAAATATAMLETPDAQEYFGDTLTDNQAFIEQIYANTLNKTAADDPEGIAYWVDLLESGMSRGQVASELVKAVAQYENSEDPATAQAYAQFTNRVAVSDYTADNLQEAPADYQTSLNFGAGLTVTSDASTVTSAQESVDALVPGVPGGSFSLTAGTDTLTGTANDDVFTAPLSSEQDGGGLSEFQTLTTGDILSGGEGTDRLNAALNGTDTSGAVDSVSPEAVDGIEQFYIQSRTVANTLDMTNVTGVEQLWNDRSTRDLTVTNLQESAVLGLNSVRQGTTYDVTYANNASSGVQTVAASGVGNATTAATLSVLDAGTAITDLTVDAVSGTNNIAVAGDLVNITDLTISGSAQLTLTEAAQFAAITTVAAGNYTGNLSLDIGAASATDLNVVTGAGNDTVTIDGTLLLAANNELVINLGEGVNTLGLAAIASNTEVDALDFTAGSVTGVDALSFADALTLAAGTTLNLEGTDAAALTFEDTVSGAFGFAVENTGAEMGLTFESTLDGAAFDLGDAVDTLVVNSEDVVGGTVAASFTGEALNSATVNAEADFTANFSGADFNSDNTVTSLSSLTLNDESQDGDSVFTVELVDTADLTSIDLSGVTATYNTALATPAFEGGSIVLDASAAAFDGAVSIEVGSAALDYTAASDSVRETFTFTADNINDIDLSSFEAGVGANRDRIDFSQFEGISSTEDLNIVANGLNAEITAADGQFDGTITLNGVAADAALEASLVF